MTARGHTIAGTVFGVGVGVVVERDGRLLLGLRRGRLGYNTWGFPGGHLEPQEGPIDCATRELFEETGLQLSGALQAGWFCHSDVERVYVTLYVTGMAHGEPVVREPDKCERWDWREATDLPGALFVPTAGYFELVRLR